MKTRILRILTVLAILLGIVAVPALATEPEQTEAPAEHTEAPTEETAQANTCGEGLTWVFSDGVLTVTGDGAMDDFEDGAAPWQAHMQQIEEVVLRGKITYIGNYAFKNCDSLLAVDFGNALYEIGKEAFRSCDGLTSLWLPESFKVFGESSFQSCKALEEIHCSGRFPSFRQNSMWDTYVTIYYPAEKPWGVTYIQQLEEAFKGRVEFLASDGTDPYDPEGEKATEAPATEPETLPPETTIPETEPVTEPETTEATEPVQTEPEQTQVTEDTSSTQPPATQETAEPEAPVQETKQKSNLLGYILLAAGAGLAGVMVGRMVFGRKKGRYAKKPQHKK